MDHHRKTRRLNPNLTHLQQLSEAKCPSATSGIEIAYARQVLYRHHIAPLDRRLHKLAEAVNTLQEIVYPIVFNAYENAREVLEDDVSQESFSWIQFPDPSDSSLLPKPLRSLAQKPSKPELFPEYERNK